MKKLNVPEQHQLKIARSTMRMHCVGARIMGGPDHLRAVNIIRNLTGKHVKLHNDCTCPA